MPLDKRTQRLNALKATALALQTRLQSQALRLGGGTEQKTSPVGQRIVVTQPKEIETVFQSTVPDPVTIAQAKEKETGFQGVLPG